MSRPTAAPVLQPEELAELLRRRDDGSSVALANGCFDLLHLGHLRFLEAAAAEADLLVVGVNADATVTALKGPGRPVLPADERAGLLAALRMVDFVTIFAEPTADRLIELLQPDVHCKGTDYAAGTPEQETARRLGVRLALVGGPKIRNTRDILASIRERRSP
jgi:rfaE bifunctional protein nucleotidyltransferase chain/domain